MSILDDIADSLAREAIALSEEIGDEDLVDRVAKVIGTTSPTVEEAFRTAARIRRAELRAKRFLEELRAKSAGA